MHESTPMKALVKSKAEKGEAETEAEVEDVVEADTESEVAADGEN